ncbi:MAG: hypothetical protein M3Y33_08570 [Actinomycetota bacterium]|nr:hypothetical protein [Actinomycetota bacterium]
MPDWYRDHDLSPDAYPESDYLDWAQFHGLYVDAAGNVSDPAESSGPAADEYCPGCRKWRDTNCRGCECNGGCTCRAALDQPGRYGDEF